MALSYSLKMLCNCSISSPLHLFLKVIEKYFLNRRCLSPLFFVMQKSITRQNLNSFEPKTCFVLVRTMNIFSVAESTSNSLCFRHSKLNVVFAKVYFCTLAYNNVTINNALLVGNETKVLIIIIIMYVT